MFSRAIILKTANLAPVRYLITKTRLFRPLTKRFIAGDTLDEAIEAAEKLVDEGLFVTMDCLGESVATDAEADAAADVYRNIILRVAQHPRPELKNVSLKLTQLGLDLGDEGAERRFRSLLELAAAHQIFVRADMESSEYTERTIRLMERVFADHKNTGTVLQSYLHRTLDDVERLIELGMRVRLVKGAYLEPASVAFQDKAKVDETYLEASRRLLDRGVYPAIATQDEAIIQELEQYIRDKKIERRTYEWQMLYGIRRDLQRKLVAEGEALRIYLPYGPSWYPYFSRRLAERPANLLFFAKNLFRS